MITKNVFTKFNETKRLQNHYGFACLNLHMHYMSQNQFSSHIMKYLFHVNLISKRGSFSMDQNGVK